MGKNHNYSRAPILCAKKGLGRDKTWRANVKTIDGGIPTVGEVTSLINQAGGTVLRVEGAHLPPNPHINYMIQSGLKGTIKILE